MTSDETSNREPRERTDAAETLADTQFVSQKAAEALAHAVRDHADTRPVNVGDVAEATVTPAGTPEPTGVRLNMPAIVKGQVLGGQFRILGDEPLGAGGMGEVWKAEDMELGVTVAIKALPLLMARNKVAVENLRREAMIGRQLAHPNICRLHSFHSDGDLKFIVMECVPGQTLQEILAERGGEPMTWDELEPIARPLADALDYAHNTTYPGPGDRQVRGVLHRDIKPGNIMVTPNPETGSWRGGTAKLMDFGIAREIHNSVTEVTGQTSQTPLYASPEQFAGKHTDAASDLYSLASVLYECLSGHRLVSAHGDIQYQVLQRPFEPRKGQSDVVNAALAAGLAREPGDRPDSAAELIRLFSAEMPAGAAGDRFDAGARIANSVGMTFVRIPPGEFAMGSPEDEPERGRDEQQHTVRITRAFYLAIAPVTQGQWKQVTGREPHGFQGDGFPVDWVSWEDAADFCRKLGELEDKPCRLPTEAEWEFACRAGVETRFGAGDDEDCLDEHAWHHGNSGRKAHAVGQKNPNAWGLCDMHGNVAEWCEDVYEKYAAGPVTDPSGPQRGASRVIRGGSWNAAPRDCRCAARGRYSPRYRGRDIGFRVVMKDD